MSFSCKAYNKNKKKHHFKEIQQLCFRQNLGVKNKCIPSDQANCICENNTPNAISTGEFTITDVCRSLNKQFPISILTLKTERKVIISSNFTNKIKKYIAEVLRIFMFSLNVRLKKKDITNRFKLQNDSEGSQRLQFVSLRFLEENLRGFKGFEVIPWLNIEVYFYLIYFIKQTR